MQIIFIYNLNQVQTTLDKILNNSNLIYDLAVTKKAKPIRIQNSQEFDDCFIQFSQVHTLYRI